MNAERFYDDLAADYDAMTAFETRLEQQQRQLQGLLARLPARRAVDMGCGTGVHAIALARLGLEVTGVDLSTAMLERARSHAARFDAELHFHHGDFLADLPRSDADLILCLGNSIPHLPSPEALTEVLSHWRSLLSPGGRLLVQLLNYERILEERERIVNIRLDGKRTIIRFYDFLPDGLQFNVLSVLHDAPQSHQLISTRLSPFTAEDMLTAARTAGYASCEVHADLAFTPFEDGAQNCVLHAVA